VATDLNAVPVSWNLRLVGHADLDGEGDCMHLNIRDGYAYVGHMGERGTSIIDVRDPGQHDKHARWRLGRQCRDRQRARRPPGSVDCGTVSPLERGQHVGEAVRLVHARHQVREPFRPGQKALWRHCYEL